MDTGEVIDTKEIEDQMIEEEKILEEDDELKSMTVQKQEKEKIEKKLKISIYERIKYRATTLKKTIKRKVTIDNEIKWEDVKIEKDIIIDMIDLLIVLCDDNEICYEIL